MTMRMRGGAYMQFNPLSDRTAIQCIHADAGFCRHFKNAHAGTDGLNVAYERLADRIRHAGEIHFGNDGDIGGVEDRRIFQRFVFAFR